MYSFYYSVKFIQNYNKKFKCTELSIDIRIVSPTEFYPQCSSWTALYNSTVLRIYVHRGYSVFYIHTVGIFWLDLFKKHELDMSTFASLNEADLTEIGVTAFGARRKMLLIIAELQKQSCGLKGAAGSSARKLPTSPPYNTPALTDKW
ncbi:unnamed protein product [Diatraea saccharalis]|uniref:SAM domain-containing protein n=1 Tax=Diatraea saccharalis TaxID=40085 RepID=A0A9N9WEF3_9NEOP|nr:unnamed protein product [Diatraea saccharalis]